MLTEGQRLLLTAYVDGELSEPQRQQVQGLLDQSGEARQLLRQLEGDALALRQLATPSLDRDLAGPVLDRIGRRLVPHRRREFSRSGAYPAWAGLVVAATILLLLGGISYFYFSAAFPAHQGDAGFAEKPVPDKKAEALPPDQPRPDKPEQNVARDEPPPPAPPRQPEQPPPTPQVAEKTPEKPDPAPEKGPATPAEINTAPTLEKFELKMVTVQPPTVLRLQDLGQDPAQTRLREELGKDSIFRIELPCRNASRAHERLRAAGKDQHFMFLVDSATHVRLKLPQLKTHYGFFAEDLTPAEVANLLLQISAEDRKAARRPADVQFDRVVIGRLSKNERKDLADLLGFDPSQPPPPRPTGPLGTDPSRPLSDLTASQVAKSLAGQGGPRSELGHPALVLGFGPWRQRNAPTEGKRYQELRKPVRQATVQIFLVLRHIGS